MRKNLAFFAALALIVSAAVFCALSDERREAKQRGFVFVTRDGRFAVTGERFRFVGANVAVMYGRDERARMPETLRRAAHDGVRVVRVWAFGEIDESNGQAEEAGSHDWLRENPFRRGPDKWNEDAFEHLDRVLAEAARHNLRVQLCLANWWRDTGGVTQYLRWAGIDDAADPQHPFGINVERAMMFYTNGETRRLYRQHVERIVSRRNTVTGTLYRDDPTIMSYELMNEAQASAGRTAERRAWIAEMSAFVKSLDPDHLVTPGTWGYRTSFERREWLEDHRLPTVDYCDVHLYPRDDLDSFVDSPEDLRAFIDNRVAAAQSLSKPLVIGEFGMVDEGYRGLSQPEWFRAFFDSAAHAGVSGACFWILTHDPEREYGITYTTARDEGVRRELIRASELFNALRDGEPPPGLRDAGKHLVPRQFTFTRTADDPATRPIVKEPDDEMVLYRFSPEQAARGRFEKLGSGSGYVWGTGVGFFEYVVPGRDKRWVGEVVVRAHLQPALPADAHGRLAATRITLFINGTECGSRLVPVETPPRALIQEWRVTALLPRARASLGGPLTIRFAVEVTAGQPFGLTISNFPEGYDAHERAPLEIELR